MNDFDNNFQNKMIIPGIIDITYNTYDKLQEVRLVSTTFGRLDGKDHLFYMLPRFKALEGDWKDYIKDQHKKMLKAPNIVGAQVQNILVIWVYTQDEYQKLKEATDNNFTAYGPGDLCFQFGQYYWNSRLLEMYTKQELLTFSNSYLRDVAFYGIPKDRQFVL